MNYPSIETLQVPGEWASNVHYLGNGYLLIENKIEGLIKMVLLYDINIDYIPFSLTANYVNYITDYSWNPSLPFRDFRRLFPINQNKLLMGCVYEYQWNWLASVVFSLSSDYMHLSIAYWINFATVSDPTGIWNIINGGLEKLEKYFFLIGIVVNHNDHGIFMYGITFYNNTNGYNTFLGVAYIGHLSSFNSFEVINFLYAEFNDIIYVLPYFGDIFDDNRGDLQYMTAINLSNFSNLVPQNTNIPTRNAWAALGSCLDPNGTKFLYYKFGNDPNLIIARVSHDNYTQIEEIGKKYLGIHINAIQVSDDCNYLYAGGNGFFIINITDITAINFVSTLWITEIFTMDKIKNKVYLMTDTKLYILNISNVFYPSIISSAFYPTYETSKGPIMGIGIIQTTDANYIYRGAYIGDSKGAHDITVFKEQLSPFYVYLKINTYPTVGKPIVYQYYCLYLKTSLSIKGAISNIYLINTTNYSLKQTLPAWIYIDSNLQTITLTVPKIYSNYSLVLVFELKKQQIDNLEVYEQSIILPLAQSTLFVLTHNNSFLSVETPVLESNIQVLIILDEPSQNVLIFQNFPGIFSVYSQKNSLLVSSGLCSAINLMFLSIRYNKKTNFISSDSNNFTITVTDYVNDDKTYNNLNIDFFKRNNPPECSKILQNVLDTQISINQINTMPTKKFEFQMDGSWFSDPDGDTLNISLSNQHNMNLPNWLTFDNFNLRMYGTPQLSDEGAYNLTLIISDSYDEIFQRIGFVIYDYPPVLKIPVKNQKTNEYVKIGEAFSLQLNPNSFQDSDGPNTLIYYVLMNGKITLSLDNKVWLNFDSQSNTLYGTPTISELIKGSKEINLTVKATDGLKFSMDNFSLLIIPSLHDNNTKANMIPQISSLYLTTVLRVNIKISEGKILLLGSFIQQNANSLTYQNTDERNNILITTNSEVLNEAFLNLVYRDSNFSSNNNLKRRLDNSNQTTSSYVSIIVEDQYGQNLNYSLKTNLFNSSNQLAILENSLILSSYFAEIGKNLRVVISKDLLKYTNLDLNLSYAFDLIKKENGLKVTWLIFDCSNNLDFYTGNNVDDSMLGSYQAILRITDGFNDHYTVEFQINVDYSLSDKVLQNFQLISKIIGPLITLFAFLKYFYLVYNMMWTGKFKNNNYFLKIKVPFKFKIPLIKQEYESACIIFEEFKELKLKADKNYFRNFLTNDIMSTKGSITSHFNFLNELKTIPKYAVVGGRKQETINCLIEGLLIKELINCHSNAKKLFKQLEKIIKKRMNLKKNDLPSASEWHNQFFYDNLKITAYDISKTSFVVNDTKVLISDYVLNCGVYKICEENIIILNEFYELIFFEVFNKSHCKFKEKEEILIKNLIIRVIITIKRGIPHNYNFISFLLNKLFIKLGCRFTPYAFGESLHLSHQENKLISCYMEVDRLINNKKYKNKFLKILFPSKIMQKYYSVNNSNYPAWLHIEQKKGILEFSGLPWNDEIKKKYLIKVLSSNNSIILQFGIIISDVYNPCENELLAKRKFKFKNSRICIKENEGSVKGILNSQFKSSDKYTLISMRETDKNTLAGSINKTDLVSENFEQINEKDDKL